MMIDSVVWAQYINVRDRQTDSHVAIANAVPTHQIVQQKLSSYICVFEYKSLEAVGEHCHHQRREVVLVLNQSTTMMAFMTA